MEIAAECKEVSLVAAIYEKYSDLSNDAANFCKIYIPNKMPGKTATGSLVVGPQLVLHNYNIVCAGDTAEIGSICGNITELDLTDNSISKWSEIFKIVDNCPQLEFLNLTNNKLDWDIDESHDYNFPGISQLVLNKTKVSFHVVVKLLNICSKIQTLHLSLNGYTEVSVPEDLQYTTLTRLHFNANKVTEWMEVSKLGYLFPNLKDLVMIESDIRLFCLDASTAHPFQHLQALNLSKSVLAGWETFEKLREFPSLTDVRLQGIPFLEKIQEKKRRQLLIGYLPSVVRLNGSSVHPQEREDAERAFIRHYMDTETKPNRYFELEEQHGKLDQLVNVSLKPQESYRVKVTFEEKSEYMEISINQSVRELKKFLQNFVGHPSSKFRLHFIQEPYRVEEMKDLSKDLRRYFTNFTDDIEFAIDLKHAKPSSTS